MESVTQTHFINSPYSHLINFLLPTLPYINLILKNLQNFANSVWKIRHRPIAANIWNLKSVGTALAISRADRTTLDRALPLLSTRKNHIERNRQSRSTRPRSPAQKGRKKREEKKERRRRKDEGVWSDPTAVTIIKFAWHRLGLEWTQIENASKNAKTGHRGEQELLNEILSYANRIQSKEKEEREWERERVREERKKAREEKGKRWKKFGSARSAKRVWRRWYRGIQLQPRKRLESGGGWRAGTSSQKGKGKYEKYDQIRPERKRERERERK